MTTPVDYFYKGYQDALQNKSKVKGLKGANKASYESGYKEGHQARSQPQPVKERHNT